MVLVSHLCSKQNCDHLHHIFYPLCISIVTVSHIVWEMLLQGHANSNNSKNMNQLAKLKQ